MLEEGLTDLQYLPPGKAAWDCTLACLAYGVRMDIERTPPDLNAWAARHAVPASKRFDELGRYAWVLWHGTSRGRAEKIIEHGLFHMKGVWTAANPRIPHSFCRGRSESRQVGTAEGAVVCLVMDRRELVEGRDFEIETGENVVRFMHNLPPDAVEYVLTADRIELTGAEPIRRPAPWPSARFKKVEGRWVPVQKAPVRYSEDRQYSSAEQFAEMCLQRLLAELGEVAALEFFSAAYAAARPWDAFSHADLLEVLAALAPLRRRRGGWQMFAGVQADG